MKVIYTSYNLHRPNFRLGDKCFFVMSTKPVVSNATKYNFVSVVLFRAYGEHDHTHSDVFYVKGMMKL